MSQREAAQTRQGNWYLDVEHRTLEVTENLELGDKTIMYSRLLSGDSISAARENQFSQRSGNSRSGRSDGEILSDPGLDRIDEQSNSQVSNG